MTHPLAWTLAALAALSAVSCSRPAAEPPRAPTIDAELRARLVEEAEDQAKSLGRTLVGELEAAIAKDGAAGAVHVCGDVAARVAADQRAKGRVLRRTALRLRNAANAPDAWERGALEAWVAGLPTVPATRSVVEQGADGTEVRVLVPVFVQGLCETCHGTPGKIPDAVRAALATKYPDDRAVGFSQGELRGAISVRVPVPK